MNRHSDSDGFLNRCRRRDFFIATVNNNLNLYLDVSSGPKKKCSRFDNTLFICVNGVADRSCQRFMCRS
jgi:hypothetical protein